MLKKLLAVIAVLAIHVGFVHVVAGEDGGLLTNADIVAMVQERLSPNVIVDRIREASHNFDLSNDAVIELKEKGVPDEVLAAMLVSSARIPAPGGALRQGGFGGMSGNLPMRSGFGGASGLDMPDLSLPNLPDLSEGNFPGMEELSLPDFSQGGPMGGDMPGVPPIPPVQPPTAVDATVAAVPMSAPVTVPGAVDLTPPTPISGGDFSAVEQAFSLPSIDSSDDFYAASSSASVSPASGGGDDAAEYEEAKTRFQKEVANIISGTPEKKSAAVAWMVANEKITLDFLRETMVKAQRPEQEAAAVYTLGQMRDVEALTEIRRRLVNRNRLVRQSAAEALIAMEDTDAISAAEKALTQRIEPRDGLIRLVGHARLVRASESLGKILAESQVPDNRIAAAWALSQLGRSATDAWPAMKKAVASDPNPDVRREAARAVSSYHDDKESLKILESSCRRDPEVRKVVLEELANYRESIPFLVNVVNLKPDQIASDELEVARATLFKLTGEDFSYDGPRWQKWLADNRTRLGLPLPPGEASGDGKVPPGMKMGPAHLAAGRPRQVDVRSWGIVADPAEIPLAPEVDDAAFPRAGSAPGGGGGRLPIPPPGLAGGPAGLSTPPGGGGMGGGMSGMGGGGSMYGDDDDYGPPRGGFGGGAPSGMGGGGMAGMGLPPPAGRFGGGGFDDDDYEVGGSSASGVRLPLPSGLLGAGGDDAPPIPVGMGSRPGMGGGGMGMSGDAGMGMGAPGGGMTGMMSGGSESFGGMTGSSFPADTGYAEAYESEYSSPSSPSYESSSMYGDSYGGTDGMYGGDVSGSYGSSYSPMDQITLPTADYSPVSVDAYTTADTIEDEVMASQPNSTGDFVPGLPSGSAAMGGMDDWATTSSSFTGAASGGFAEADEIGGDFEYEAANGFGMGAGGMDGLDFPQSASGIPAPPSGVGMGTPPPAALPGVDGANVISFPDDKTSFGLGEPMFNEYGQPSSAEATELPPAPGMTTPASASGGSLALPPPTATLQQELPPATATATVVGEVGMPQGGFVPVSPGGGLQAGTRFEMPDGYEDFDSSGFGEFSDGSDSGYGVETGGAFVSGGFPGAAGGFEDEGGYGSAVAGEVQGAAGMYGDYSTGADDGFGMTEAYGEEDFGAVNRGGYQAQAMGEYDFDDYGDEGADEDLGGEYAAESRELPEGFTFGGASGQQGSAAAGSAAGAGVSVPGSPPASSLHLPSRKRRRGHGESAIVSHGVPGTAAGAAAAVSRESAMPPPPAGGGVSAGVSAALEQQAVRARESVLITGPARILDEDGRTAAIVMNTDDELLPPSANMSDMYVQEFETDDWGAAAGQVVEARELPASRPVVRQGSAAGGGADITVETSPSQSPGRNFRRKK